jgi:hypothetical protein
VVSNAEALLQPILVSYLCDLSISAINDYMNTDDNRVLNSNNIAKRCEAVQVDVTVSVRTTQSELAIVQLISLFINSYSNITFSKDQLVQYLYSQNAVTYVNMDSLVLSGEYDACTGQITEYSNVSEIFGASTAAYIARNINVTILSPQITN